MTQTTLRHRDWRWLSAEAEAWTHDGLITGDQRERILARYHVDATAAERRGLAVLTALGALAGAIAVLLLIGYNWDAIARSAKVALIFGTVALTFVASAVAYARGRDTAGEVLAFTGTLFYGNAIWLLAQVFHISGHYPDAAMWWAIGALVAAHVLASHLIAFQAAVLVGVWVLMAITGFSGPTYLFLPIGAAALWLAYRVRSAWVLGLVALATVYWAVVSTGLALSAGRLAMAVGLLTGAAFYATSRFHAEDSRFHKTWQALGLVVMGVFLVPLMIHDLQTQSATRSITTLWEVLAVTAGLVGVQAVAALRTPRKPLDTPVRLASALAIAWMAWFVAAPVVTWPPAIAWTIVIAFSTTTLAIGVTLMRTGMQRNRAGLFAAGVGYVLVFLLVRWIDLLGSMVWSALFLLGVAALLLWIAAVWRTRARAPAAMPSRG
jgi:uncharacterized membrane protein